GATAALGLVVARQLGALCPPTSTVKNAMKHEVRQVRARQPPGQRANREALLEAIADEQTLLARLDREQADVRARLAALQAELASRGTEPEIRVSLPLSTKASVSSVPRTPAEKVKLFHSLFRGREDVFPTRFVAKRTGKPGYAPACRNKFVKGVCELP